jgi:hypothetical protein
MTDRIRDLRRQRDAARQERDRAREAFANAHRTGDVRTWPEFRRAAAAVRALAEIEQQIRAEEGEAAYPPASTAARSCGSCGREHWRAGTDLCWVCDATAATASAAPAPRQMETSPSQPRGRSREALLDALDAL